MKSAITTLIVGVLNLTAVFLHPVHTQSPTQQVRGIIRDQKTQEPLLGATVQLVNAKFPTGTTTNFDGEFVLENIEVGRIRLQCDYLGYLTYITSPFILSTGKVPYLEIEMTEANIELQEVVVKARKNDARTQNEMVLLSGRSFTAEETERYAGSIADPSRMAVSYAGVQASNDLDNDVVVRGNSSIGVLWRLEGIDIPNPNHFARRGSSGGGISIFSVNMLRNSDFIYGNLPADYGNTLSSVFDMKFRKGNVETRGYSLRAGLLGLDILGEGPIKKQNSSYLINYRYSTLGMLNQMGVHVVDKNTDNNFTDLSFHLHFTSDNNKNIIQWWGIGGLSSELHHPIDDPAERREFEDQVFTDFKTRMGVTGVSWTRIFSNNSYLQCKLAVMADHITHAKDTIDSELQRGFLLDEAYTTKRMTAALVYNKKMTANFSIKSGFSGTVQEFDLFYQKYERPFQSLRTFIDEKGDNEELHAFVQSIASISNKLQLTGGLHYIYHSINGNQRVEPRLTLSYDLHPGLNVGLAFGLQSQVVPLGTYFTHPGNRTLPFMKSSQWTAAINKKLNSKWSASAEFYLQQLSNIPVIDNPDTHYWMLNDLVGYAPYALIPSGKGRNYGMEFTLERSFDDGYFIIGSVSWYKATYSLGDDKYFGSRYDGRFNTGLAAGKEFYLANGNMIQLGFRNLWYGGQRYAPSDDQITRTYQDYYEDLTQSLTQQNKAYWRSDGRIMYRHNQSSRSWSLSLDIQNILNRKNTRGQIWNFRDKLYEDKLQAGIIPVVTYQLDF